ncbi:hypothetical protein [Candidatus Poriferisodalis sp.]|uniref:hypothetical protein n=1 Tax=Candidatus Poriferisodalis sp. TaxID=3101277 RepID=UPI003B02CAF6
MVGGSDTSSYVRVDTYRGVPLVETVDISGGLMFIDVAGSHAGDWHGAVAAQLRSVDEFVLAACRCVLIRSPEPLDSGVDQGTGVIQAVINQRGGSAPPVGACWFDFGDKSGPQMWWSETDPSRNDGQMLASARSVELAALVQAGRAHWRPTTFHYELPSDEHRSDFIRVGDVFRSPRDAAALATWLYPYARADQTILLDSSTILPIVLALQTAAASHEVKLGHVAVRDAYPHSLLADEELIELTVGAGGALVLISVSSTGHTEHALAACLKTKIGSGWALQTLVDRARPASTQWPAANGGLQDPWLHIPGGNSFTQDDCELCDSADAAPCVRIDSASFTNTSLPEPHVVVMPDPPVGARSIANLLEMYDDVDGMGIDCDPAERTRLRRDPGRWGVRFYPHLLLAHDRFVEALEEQMGHRSDNPNDGRSDLDKLTGVDAIVALDEDADSTGFDRFVEWASRRFAETPAQVFTIASKPADGERDRLARQLRGKRHILVLTVGTVTGGTLREILIRVHRALSGQPPNSYIISGLVVHARPPSFREWQSTRSSYSQRLVAVWMTYLPSRDHPLSVEQRLFRQTLDEDRLSDQVRQYAQDRRDWVLSSPHSDWLKRRQTWQHQSGAPNPAAVLLCGSPERSDDQLPRLLPNSLFGDRMSMVGTLVGVGAALHRRRLERESQGGPPGLRFDLSRIPAVYFEVPILSAVLRWIRPFEAFWEYRGLSVRDVLRDLWAKTDFEEPGSRETLLAELALAAAAGKIPKRAKDTIEEFFEQVADDDGALDAVPLDVAKQLLEAAWGPLKDRDDHESVCDHT